MNKISSKSVFTIPNILSFFRLALIPVIVWLYCKKENYTLTAALLILSGLTDLIDGYIARHYNMVSDIGKMLDPAADKLTQLAMLYCLTTLFPLMLLPFGLLFIKELIATILGVMVIRSTKRVHSASWHGKVSTVLLYAMMTLHVLWSSIPKTVSDITVYMCTCMILLSFAMYSTSYITTIIKSKKDS